LCRSTTNLLVHCRGGCKREDVMKTTKKWIILGIGMFLVYFSFFVNIGHTAESVIKLDFASFYPATHRVGIILEEWSKDMGKRTNGRIQINYYPGETLMPQPQTYDSVAKGIADIGTGAFAFLKGRAPLTEVLDLPLGVKSSVMANRLANAYYQAFKPKELDDTHILILKVPGPQILHTKKPIRKLEDVKGLKIRVTGGVGVSVVQALGAIPISMPIGDTYDALQKGAVDGLITPVEALVTFKFGDVVTHTLNTSVFSVNGYLTFNKTKWNSLPSDIRTIIEASIPALLEKIGTTFDAIDGEALKSLVSKGHTVTTLPKNEEDKWQNAMQPILQQYVKENTAKGLPAAEALKFCQDWLKKNQK
jgi:TRAP-type transport system periplasmic protein